jgi:hypothetical protein
MAAEIVATEPPDAGGKRAAQGNVEVAHPGLVNDFA